MIGVLDWATATGEERRRLLRRSAVPDPDVRRAAAAIVDEVRRGGFAAVVAANARFGGGRGDGTLEVPREEWAAAWDRTSPDVRDALAAAAANIRTAHTPQLPTDHPLEVIPGVHVDRRWTPLRRVGVYVPGGGAAYPSSLLMGVIPARIAGVPELVVTSPADPAGRLDDTLLAAAHMLGVDAIYAVGGAQAIALLAYGAEGVAPVDKIVGPGNSWVTAAKLAVFGDCAVDLPAGPSEALVVADGSADPWIVAADLLCQAEHGPDSPVTLVTDDAELPDRVLAAVAALLPSLERSAVLAKSLGDHGTAVVVPDLDTAVEVANEYASEHVSVHTADAAAVAAGITRAGSVFVGHWSPESAGDYATGANHVLPTGGLAGAYGPLSVEDFGSWRQVQELTEEGLAALRPTITALAQAEGLTAHRLAADIRFDPPQERNPE